MSDATPPASPPTRRALVIGVNGSAHESSVATLANAESDARAIAAVLEAPACGFVAESLTGEQATASSLRQAIEDLLYEATPATELLVYFSGHAVPVALGPRENETFLVTSDFDAARAVRQPTRYLSLRWLYEHLYRDPTAGRVLIFLDCCFAGNILGLGDAHLTLDFRTVLEQFRTGLDAQTATRYTEKLRVIIPAVGPGQKARELHGMGLATRVLHELLTGAVPHTELGDGRVTVDLLIDRLRKTLPDHAPAPASIGQGLYVLANLCADVAAARAAPATAHAALRETTLRALIHDHSGFIANRLEAFVGRQSELAEIRARVAATRATGDYVTVTGHAGQGKSSIIARVLQEYGPDTTAHHFIPIKPGPDHQVGLMRNILARLILKHGLSEIYVASDSRPALRDYFAQALREIAATGAQEIIVIDGLDQIEEDLNGERDLSFLPLEPPPGIVFLLGTRPNDTLKPLELRKPHTEYWLPNLSREDFTQVLAHRGVTTLDAALTERFYAAMQENALYLDLVARELAQPGALAPEALIARIADNPDNLFSLSIERLKADRQRWRTVLKPVLGLLLAARDPLSARAIRALIGVEDDECREGLQRLGGLLARDGEGRWYLYHLKLSDYLRQNPAQPQKAYVFATDEEERYHQQLADWGTGGRGGLATIWTAVTGDALEQERRAYAQQHYVAHLAAARSYDQLWACVDTGDYGRAKLRHDPSGRSYVRDLDVARDAVIASAHGDAAAEVAILPRLWRYSLLRGSLASQADNVPDALFPLMAHLGREQEAVNIAELLNNPLRKGFALLQIAVACKQAPATRQLSTQLFARAQTVLSDLWRQEPMRLVSLLNDADDAVLSDLVLAGDANVIEVLANATTARPETPDCSDETDTILTLIRMVLIIARSLITTAQFSLTVPATLWEDLYDYDYEYVRMLSYVPTLLRAIGRSLARTNELDLVLAHIGAITEAEYRIPILALAAFVVEQTGQIEVAQHLRHTVVMAVDADEPSANRDALRNNLAAALLMTERFDEALTTARTIQDAYDRDHGIYIIATSLSQTQRFDEALTVVRTIGDAYGRDDVLDSIVTSLSQTDRFAEALTIARTIEIADDRAAALGSLATSLSHAQRFADAAAVLAEALTTVRTIEHTVHRAFAYRRASALSTIATSLSHAQRFAEAAAVLAEALTTARTIEDASHRATTLSRIATNLSDAQCFAEALMVVRTIELAYFRADDLRSIATSLAQAQCFEEALTVVCTIEVADLRADAIGTIATSLSHTQRFEEALTVVRTIEAADARAATLCTIATSLSQAQRFAEAAAVLDEALTTARTIEAADARADAIGTIATSLSQAQRFVEAQTTARTIEDADARADALCTIATSLSQAQRFAEAAAVLDEALMTARTIEAAHHSATTLSHIATNLSDVQCFAEAAAVLDEALMTARTIEEALYRASALRTIAMSFSHAQRFAEVAAVLEEALTTARRIEDADFRAALLCTIATSLSQTQRFAEALTTTRTIEDAYSRERADILGTIVTSLAHAQRFAEALTTTRTIEDAAARAAAISSIATSLSQAQRFDEGTAVFDEALTTARTIEDAAARAAALSSIATSLSHAQCFAEAAAVLDEALTTARTIEDADDRAAALDTIATSLSQAQRFDEAAVVLDEALTTARTIEEAYFRAAALGRIATSLSQAQRFVEALTTARTIEDADARADALRTIASSLVEAQRLDQLRALVLETWRAAATADELWQLASLPQGQMIIESSLHQGLGESIAWVRQMLQ